MTTDEREALSELLGHCIGQVERNADLLSRWEHRPKVAGATREKTQFLMERWRRRRDALLKAIQELQPSSLEGETR